MIFDIASLIVIVAFVIVGIKTGAAKILIRLISYVLSAVLSGIIAHFLADFIYNTFIKSYVISNIESALADTGINTVAEKTANIMSSIPFVFSNVLGYFGFADSNVENVLKAGESSAAESIAQSLEQIIMPAFVGVISVLLAILLFGILFFIIKKLLRVVEKFFRLPIIKIVDSFAGALLGCAEGMMILYFAVLIIKLLIPLSGGSWPVVNEEYIRESLFFSYLYFGNLTTFVQNLVFAI